MNRSSLLRSILFATVVFMASFSVPSLINGLPDKLSFSLQALWQNETSEKIFEFRSNHFEFSRRPIVLKFQSFMDDAFKIPKQFSFNLINFICLVLFFGFIPELSNIRDSNPKVEIYTQYFILSSFPIIFAYYPTIYVYDDIIQYLLLTLFLIGLFKQNLVLASFLFFFACLARETSFLYLPVFAAFLYQQKKPLLLVFSIISLPLISYILILFFRFESVQFDQARLFFLEERLFAWVNNFTPFNHFRESSTILIITVGPVFYLLMKALSRNKHDNRLTFWLISAMCLLIINTLIVSVSGLIREARLLFLPYIFALPFIKEEIAISLSVVKKHWKAISSINYAVFMILGFIFAFVWFIPKASGIGYLFKAYTFCFSIIFQLIIFLTHTKNSSLSTI